MRCLLACLSLGKGLLRLSLECPIGVRRWALPRASTASPQQLGALQQELTFSPFWSPGI